jgi:NDP-sugar pyrophosphorylase family protein
LKAAILAGGEGVRLRPLTYLYPKIMMPLGGKPILEYTIDYLKGYGIDEIVLCVAYLRNRIKEYFHDGGEWDVKINYAEADKPLGTAGQLSTARKLLSEDFLAMNGDIITSLNLESMVQTHQDLESAATVAVRKVSTEVPYGCVELDGASRLTSFREKPELTYLANAGLYVMSPKVFDYIKIPPAPLDLERDVFPRMIAAGERVSGYTSDASWSHIGSVADLEKIDKEMFPNNHVGAVPPEPLQVAPVPRSKIHPDRS